MVKLILLLWCGFLAKYRAASAPLDCATRVDQCPTNKDEWNQKNILWNCETNHGYVCLRDTEGFFVETCMANFTLKANTNPNCIKPVYIDVVGFTSSASGETGSSTSSTSMTEIVYDDTKRTDTKHIIIVIASLLCLLASITVCLMCYCRVSKSKRPDSKKLRKEMIRINEADAEWIRILPFKIVDFDSFYVHQSIVDEYRNRYSGTRGEETVPNITPEMMFNIDRETPARFIFMLGDAGYGKTVQCQRIVKSWCKTWKEVDERSDKESDTHPLVSDVDRSLKKFDFLFFVKLSDFQNEISLIDMIKEVLRKNGFTIPFDQIERILTEGHYRSLVLLDGLDEWNLSEEKKCRLLDKCIPNCRNMLKCTILISMRSWKFIEVEEICRKSFDLVLRLNGLEENAMKKLTTNILNSYIEWKDKNFRSDEKSHEERCSHVQASVSSTTFALKSLMRIPLLAVFCIFTLYEGDQIGNSLTTSYLSIIEALIKKSSGKEQMETLHNTETNSESIFQGKLKDYPQIKNLMPKLSSLGKMAFINLSSEGTSLIFEKSELNKHVNKEDMDRFLKIGLVTKEQYCGKFFQDTIKLSFLHKTIQEFLSALYLFGRREPDILKHVSSTVTNIGKVLEFSQVITFLSGLSPEDGCKISEHIRNLTSEDEVIGRYREYLDIETYQKVFNLYNLQLQCYREVRGSESIESYEAGEHKHNFHFSDVILLDNNTDKLAIRETAEVLHFHKNDIISLIVVRIPDDNENGITNEEIARFLNKSTSIQSLYINGFAKGKCRLFNESSLLLSPNRKCLRDFGIANVAFDRNNLAESLIKEESIQNIRTLGLLYLKADDDLEVEFEYIAPSIDSINTNRAGFISRTRAIAAEKQRPTEKTPILAYFLNILPEYKSLSTLYISYMEAEKDRLKLLEVLPALNRIETLEHIGYRGSSIYRIRDDEYDTTVIKIILKLDKLRKLHLRYIHVEDNILHFENMSKLERIWIGMLQLSSSSAWNAFFKSLGGIENLRKVILNDTNITTEVLEESKVFLPSVDIVSDDSKDLNN